MEIETFELERRQSLWENHVDYNLTESGIHPLTFEELLTEDELHKLLNLRLGYGQTNGSIPLRKNIAGIYPETDIDIENILVTNGTSEANFIAIHALLEPGDELVYMLPNYQQMDGLARSYGIDVKPFYLYEHERWRPDLDELEQIVSPHTDMIAVCNPNNPTGSVLREQDMERIIEIAETNNAILYADEVYRGAELSGEESSFLGRYDKAVVCGGLSKSYALPGLRIGWLAGPQNLIQEAWRHRDYTSICSSLPSQFAAQKALQPGRRQWILNRNRELLTKNLEWFREWIDQNGRFDYRAPEAGGIVFVKYDMNINSTELTERLREDQSVFLVAGDCFGLDGYLRIGIGAETEYLQKGMERFKTWLRNFE